MIFRKPFEENFIGKAPNYGYPFISTQIAEQTGAHCSQERQGCHEMVNQLLRKDMEFLEELTCTNLQP